MPPWSLTSEHLAPTYRLRVGVPGGSSGIDIARRLGLPRTVVDRAAALLSPESHEAAGLIAYLHRSRDNSNKCSATSPSRRADFGSTSDELCARSGWRASGSESTNSKEIRRRDCETRARNSRVCSKLCRTPKCVPNSKSRRAARPAKARAEARSEADAAVVAHLSESQADLGIAAEIARPPNDDELIPGVRVRVRGFSAPLLLRRRDRGTAEVEAGPLRMKVPLAEIMAIVVEDPTKSAGKTIPGRQALKSGAPAARTPGAPPPPANVASTRRSPAVDDDGRRRNQPDWLHSRRSHPPRRQIHR